MGSAQQESMGGVKHWKAGQESGVEREETGSFEPLTPLAPLMMVSFGFRSLAPCRSHSHFLGVSTTNTVSAALNTARPKPCTQMRVS